MTEITSPQGLVRQVNSLIPIFLTKIFDAWMMHGYGFPKSWKAVAIIPVPLTPLKYLPQKAWLLEAKKKVLQNFNKALLVQNCHGVRASYLQLSIWICKLEERGKEQKKRAVFRRHVQLDHVSLGLQLLRQKKQPKFSPSTKPAMASFPANHSRDRMAFQISIYDQRATAYDKYLYGTLNNSLYKYYSKCVCWKPQTSQFILKQMC